MRLGRLLRAGDLVVLTGGLGAGKTTLTQGIGAGLGVRGPVTSPTFVIARVHPSTVGGPALVHVDAYRLGGALELDDLDLDADVADSVTVVEWGHGVAERLADAYLEVVLTAGADEARTLTLTGFGDRWRPWSRPEPPRRAHQRALLPYATRNGRFRATNARRCVRPRERWVACAGAAARHRHVDGHWSPETAHSGSRSAATPVGVLAAVAQDATTAVSGARTRSGPASAPRRPPPSARPRGGRRPALGQAVPHSTTVTVSSTRRRGRGRRARGRPAGMRRRAPAPGRPPSTGGPGR